MNFLGRNLWSNRFGYHLQNTETMTEAGWNYMPTCISFKESYDMWIPSNFKHYITETGPYYKMENIIWIKLKYNTYINVYNKNKWPISANDITSTNYTDMWTWERMNIITNRKTSYNVQQCFWYHTTGSSYMVDLQLTKKFHLITLIRKAHH